MKLQIYAESGVPEYWVVNLVEHCVEVHRDPTPSGYASAARYRSGDSIELLRFAGVTIAVSDFLR